MLIIRGDFPDEIDGPELIRKTGYRPVKQALMGGDVGVAESALIT